MSRRERGSGNTGHLQGPPLPTTATSLWAPGVPHGLPRSSFLWFRSSPTSSQSPGSLKPRIVPETSRDTPGSPPADYLPVVSTASEGQRGEERCVTVGLAIMEPYLVGIKPNALNQIHTLVCRERTSTNPTEADTTWSRYRTEQRSTWENSTHAMGSITNVMTY